MQAAIDETNRRREKQRQYNAEHGIVPRTVTKAVRETLRGEIEERLAGRVVSDEVASVMESDDLEDVIRALEVEMKRAAEDLISNARPICGTRSRN